MLIWTVSQCANTFLPSLSFYFRISFPKPKKKELIHQSSHLHLHLTTQTNVASINTFIFIQISRVLDLSVQSQNPPNFQSFGFREKSWWRRRRSRKNVFCRPLMASECRNLAEADKWRQQIFPRDRPENL